MSRETKEIVEYRWPKKVISSEDAHWSFRPNTDFYSLMNEYSKSNEKEWEGKIFVDGQWVKRRKDLYVKLVSRHPGVSNSWEEYTEYKGEKEANKVEKNTYCLTSYKENNLEIRTFYLTNIDGVNPTRFQRENKKTWKEELESLVSLWNCGELFFDSKRTEKIFFEEYNKLVRSS